MDVISISDSEHSAREPYDDNNNNNNNNNNNDSDNELSDDIDYDSNDSIDGDDGGFDMIEDDDGFGYDEDDEEDENMDFAFASPEVVVSTVEAEYEIISPDLLVQRQSQQIDTITEVLNVSVPNAKIILRKYKWNTERVLQEFSDHGGEEILRGAGLSTRPHQSGSNTVDPDSEFSCSLCCDDCTISETTQLSGCGHRFCNSCWTTYISIKIREGQSRDIKCMGHKCPTAVDESLVLKRLEDDHALRQRYVKSVVESFVEDSTHVKWCPSVPSCGNAVISKLSPTSPLVVKCKCKFEFCFACGQAPHLPCTCNMVKHWMKKCEDDSETFNWINANTKDCPGCQKPIEKNGGCNHMNCSRCNTHFCWLCVKPFNNGEYDHNCGRYDDQHSHTNNTSQKSLKRYLHYYERYVVHQDSLNKTETKESIEEKIEEVTKLRPNNPWVLNGWIENATKALNVARSTLMFSFAMAFYLFDHIGEADSRVREGYKLFDVNEMENAKNRFEDKQEQLDIGTEHLADLLEREATELAYDDSLQKDIISATSLCDSYVWALIEATREELVIDQSIIPKTKPILSKGCRTNSQPWFQQLTTKVSEEENNDAARNDEEDVSEFQRDENFDMGDDGVIDVDALDEEDTEVQRAILESMERQ